MTQLKSMDYFPTYLKNIWLALYIICPHSHPVAEVNK